MEKVTIKVNVSKAVAIAEGKTEYGSTTFRPTESQLAELTTEERSLVIAGKYLQSDSHYESSELELVSATVDWTTIRAVLARCVAFKAELAARKAATREDEVRAFLAKSPIYNTGFGNWELYTGHRSGIKNDWRVEAHVEANRAEYDRLVAEYRTNEDRARAEREAKVVAKLAADEAAEEQFQAYAKTIDTLSRAVTEGYDIRTGVVDHLAARVASIDSDTVILREGSVEYDAVTWDDRSSPNPQAFAAYDRVKAHLATIEKPACVAFDLLKIKRVDFPEDGEVAKYTAIVVVVESPVTKDRVVIFSAE